MGSEKKVFERASRADSIVGRPVWTDRAALVPVLALEAHLLEGARERWPGASGAAGTAALELLGVWIGARGAAQLWLPAREQPPDGANSWSSWLAARPGLLHEIGRALADAESAGGSRA